MAEGKKQFPANYAVAVARRLLGLLTPAAERIEIVGSLRRGKDWVHDVDILLIPQPLDVEEMFGQPAGVHTAVDVAVNCIVAEHPNISFRIKSDGKQANGADIKMLNIANPHKPELDGLTIDLYSASAETYPTLLLIRTGSVQHNIKLTSLAKRRGWTLKADGTGVVNERGERIAWQSEAEIFTMLGLDYVEPAQREV